MTKTIPLRGDLDYLLAPRNAWWRWSADGRWVEWVDGRTIAARDELRVVLERLAPRGLPPLGAVLLLLAATRKGWSGERSAELVAASTLSLEGGAGRGTAALLDGVVARRLRTDAAEIVEDLSVVAALPAHLREPVAAKAALAEYLFLDAYVAVPPPAADGVIALLAEGFDDTGASTSVDAVKRADLEFSALRPGLARVQTTNLERWMKTGLHALVKPADVAIPQAKQVRSLLHQLRDDPELSALARVASQLLAAVHVPRNLRAHEELPLGGVSDISNRGSFDRLLVSELAHDPLTLAIRVAMNEALYLRREAPARHPPVTRTVLIDGGIRMWGVPRLYACAVALALAASSDPNDPCQVLRTHGKASTRINVSTRAGLEDHLAQLNPWPDPADALLAYAREAEAAKASAEEVFLIVERGTFEDAAFWRRISPLLDGLTINVAAVAGDGSFELVSPTRLGRRQIASARLDLTQLLEDRSPTAVKQILARDPALPMILQLPEFPLRFPARVDPRFATVTASGWLVGVTHDRRLMQWTSESVGARPLLEALPAGELRGVYADPDRDVVYVCLTRRKTSRLVVATVDVRSGGSAVKEYAAAHPSEILLHRGVFLLMSRDSFSVLHPERGNIRQHSVPAGAIWTSGRFYRHWPGRSLFAAAEDGAVLVRDDFDGLLAFDRAGKGPWMLGPKWNFRAVDSEEAVNPQYEDPTQREYAPARFSTSADGERVLLVAKPSGRGFKATGVNLGTSKPATFNDPDRAHAFLLGQPVRWSWDAGLNVLKNLVAMGVDGEGQIALRAGGGRVRHVVLRRDARGLLRADMVWGELSLRAARTFSPPRRIANTAFRLRETAWPNGSRAWIDPRGMLHLKSDQRSKPEITCVIGSNGGLGGWTSDGQTFGWRFFLGGEPTLDDAHAAALLWSFAERLT